MTEQEKRNTASETEDFLPSENRQKPTDTLPTKEKKEPVIQNSRHEPPNISETTSTHRSSPSSDQKKASISQPSPDATKEQVQRELISELQDTVIELQYEMDECRQKLNTTMALLTILSREDADWNRTKMVLDAYRQKQNKIYQNRRTQQQTETASPHPINNGTGTQAASVSTGTIPVQRKPQTTVQPQKTDSDLRKQPVRKEVKHTGRKRPHLDPPEQEDKPGKLGKLGDILFYVALVVIVGAVIIMSLTSGDGVKTFLGHSVFFVKTSSMEDVYPKGSMIITRQVDVSELEVGDDITYMTNETTTITHRIISIIENYENTGERGFKTQGVMNKNPDKDIVSAANVVGKVIFGNMFLGTVMLFVSNNWPLLVFFAAVILIMILVMKRIFREEPEDDPTDDPPETPTVHRPNSATRSAQNISTGSSHRKGQR
ncbi:MAG: signal peptidase I [Clostridia bacterium]|nr:signal peptidase I [Clostridia bacterium]